MTNSIDKTINLKPALVLGSGFHRHVFGDASHPTIMPLYDWHCLVGQVAIKMQVAVPSEMLSPVQRWETLILRATQENFKDHKGEWIKSGTRPAYVIEKEMRRIAATILRESSLQYPKSTRSQIPLLDCWGAVISLNFDAAWINDKTAKNDIKPNELLPRSGKLDHREYKRLTYNRLVNGVGSGAYRRVWFPNGSCDGPETIRMGLHDYGTAPHSIQVAFDCLKKWERDNGISNKSPAVQLSECSVALLKASEGVSNLSEFFGELKFPLSWVADFLYRPLIFAGVGLSDQEAGLWWLLAQRARNKARTGAPANVFILLNEKDRPDFWRCKPFGIEPMVYSNWDEGWERVVLKANEYSA